MTRHRNYEERERRWVSSIWNPAHTVSNALGTEWNSTVNDSFHPDTLKNEWNSIVSVSFHPNTLENEWNSTMSVSLHPHTLENERNSARSVLFHNTTQHLNTIEGLYMRLQNKFMCCGSCFILPSHTFLAYMVRSLENSAMKHTTWNDLSRSCPKVRCHIIALYWPLL
jgi:hypothetical protein